MKILVMILASFTLLFCSLQSHAEGGQREPVYTEKKKVIMVSPRAPRFVIKLNGNPSTGYKWTLRDYDSNLLSPRRHEHFGAGGIGASSNEYWRFKVRRHAFTLPKMTRIKFDYHGPTEGKERQIVFKVVILPAIGH